MGSAAIPAAIVGGSVIGGAASYLGAGKAANAQQDAAKEAGEIQWNMYAQNREDLAPWREAGVWALGSRAQSVEDLQAEKTTLTNELAALRATRSRGTPGTLVPGPKMDMTGPGSQGPYYWDSPPPPGTPGYLEPGHYAGGTPAGAPQNPARINEVTNRLAELNTQIEAGGVPGQGLQGMIEAGPGEFTESPGYQFTLREGEKGMENALSAMGRNRSGSHIKAGVKYAEDMASTEYDNFLARWYQSLTPYQSMAGLGQTAAGQTVAAGQNAASGAANAAIYGGNVQGQGYINQANALTGAMQGGTNQLLYLNAMRNYQPQPASQNYNYGYGSGNAGYGGRGGV